MSVLVFNRFAATLALATLAGAVLLILPSLRARLASRTPSLSAALAVALVSTLGSLAYSEIYHFEPCRLCWYQRIAMYPLVLLLGLGLFRRDRAVAPYAAVQAGVGGLISAYHYTLQTFPGLGDGACSVGVPCSAKYVNEFGFVSIPLMAFAGFFFIVVILLSGRTES